MKGLRYNLFVLAVLALTITPSLAFGQRNTGETFPPNPCCPDPNYTLMPFGLFPGPAYSMTTGYPAQPSPASHWINPWGDANMNGPSGLYDYDTTFDLGFSPVNLVNIEGKMAADNSACLSANLFHFVGCNPPFPPGGNRGFDSYTHFVIPFSPDLHPGANNDLLFVVTNLNTSWGTPTPTGLDVEFFCPPSPSLYNGQSPAPPPVFGLYYDGPAQAWINAWTINYGYIVSDSFNIGSGTPVTGFCFFAWVEPTTEIPKTVDWSLTSAADGGTVYGEGTAPLTCILYCKAGDTLAPPEFPPPARPFPCGNVYPVNVYACTSDPIGPVSLDFAGTYWFNLFNATTSPAGGGLVSWDQNNGLGCPPGTGCPSVAEENAVGRIMPESFILYGP